jgi:hypothetical protein
MPTSPNCLRQTYGYVGADSPHLDELQAGVREVDAQGREDDPGLGECLPEGIHCRMRVDVPLFRSSHEQDGRSGELRGTRGVARSFLTVW